jgi:two-component system chemotaxis response regulator CheY
MIPSLKVLIVDDLAAMREQFIGMFRDYVPDAEIHEACDVMEAMERLRKEYPPYDCVFTDVNMPTVSGLKLIPLIRNLDAYRQTPVIVLSTLTGRTDIGRALQLGANAYLTRPYESEYFDIIYLAYLSPLCEKKGRKV